MNQPNAVTVQILDKEYLIGCPPEEQHNLQNAARYLDGKMREIRRSGKVVGADRIAVMAALNITHELLHKQQHLTEQANDQQKQVKALIDKAETALADAQATD